MHELLVSSNDVAGENNNDEKGRLKMESGPINNRYMFRNWTSRPPLLSRDITQYTSTWSNPLTGAKPCLVAPGVWGPSSSSLRKQAPQGSKEDSV